MKKFRGVYYWFAGFVLAYGLITVLTPIDTAAAAKYHLTALAMHIITLSFVVPLIAIWAVAFYGSTKLYDYARTIRRNKDGRQVMRISVGIGLLAFTLPITSILSGLLHAHALKHPSFTAASIIINNYVAVALALVAFTVIESGARGLSMLVKIRPSGNGVRVMTAIVIIIGVVYCYFVLGPGKPYQTYHMPGWLVLFTIVVPYVFAWSLGLIAAYEIHLYNNKVPGILYRQSWKLLFSGLASIIVMSILLQYLTNLPGMLNSLSISGLLLLVFVLLIGIAIGYLLLALGARKLQQIEEV